MYVCMCVCVHVCMCACMSVCMHVGMYACLYACMYVSIQWLVRLCACTKLMVACEQFSCGVDDNFSSFAYVEENTTIKTSKSGLYRAFSLTRPASILIYWRKRKCLHKERIQLPKDFLDTPTWPPFHCFETSTWPPWHHVKTLIISSAPKRGCV